MAPGLMDQVLDRQEQVKDWKLLDQQWREFVEEVLKRGKCLQTPHRLPLDATFVLVIDDVDLQVERIRDLLPAIRLLSRHHSVWFLVAGDSKHMQDMLYADFLGQQLRLVGKDVSDSQDRRDKQIKWAATLAKASFQKVFELRNQFQVRPLSAKQLLLFPEHDKSKSMQAFLNEWKTHSTNGKRGEVTKARFGDLGDYLSTFLDDPEILPEFMPYRLAHQIFEQAERSREDTRALEAARQMISVHDPDDSVAIVKRGPHRQIVYRAVGTLSAFSSKGFAEPIDNDSEITLSGQARFDYRTGALQDKQRLMGPEQHELAPALFALSLRDDEFGVAAPNLKWDITLAMAWTSAKVREDGQNCDLAFRWQLHEHPSPLRLLNWTKDWREFIEGLSATAKDLVPRIAYAWIYYQLSWLRENQWNDERNQNIEQPRMKTPVEDLPDPLADNYASGWEQLLGRSPETGSEEERRRWHTRIHPLNLRAQRIIALCPGRATRRIDLRRPMAVIRRGGDRQHGADRLDPY